MTNEEQFYNLIKKEADYYRKVLSITHLEIKSLQGHQPLQQIDPLLKEKKTLLSQISDLEKEAYPLKIYWQSKMDRSDEVSLEVQKELGHLDKLLKEILQLDMKAQEMLEKYK